MPIVEEDTVVRVREHSHVIIIDVPNVQLVDENKRVLEVDVVVRDAVHQQEPGVVTQCGCVADGRVIVARGVMLGRVHVSLRINRVCLSLI